MFERTEEQQALAEAVRSFCVAEIAPHAEADDEAERFRKELVSAMGEQGFCGVPTPEEYGGLGLGYLDYCIVLEEIAKVSAAYAVTVAVNGLPQIILGKMGSEEQRQAWLPRLAAGEALGAFALSESGSGSDAAALRTTAVQRGGEWVLNGSKMWITSAGYADLYVVMARTGGVGPRGISAFLVPGDTAGVSFGKKERKMGMRASPTAELVLEDVRVPLDALVSGEGQGFTVAMAALDSGRITIGATAVGLAQAALDTAGTYATEREQFGQPIVDFQGVSFMLADMACRVEAARLLVHKAAWMRDNDRDYSPIAAMAKCVATDAAMAVTTDAVQVLGGNGYTREYPTERYMRDAKVMQIVEGTNQIQRLVIGRHLKRTYTR